MHRSVRVALPLFFLCLTGVVVPAVASNPEAESLIGMWGGGVGHTDPSAGRWSSVTVRFDEIEDGRLSGQLTGYKDKLTGRVKEGRIEFSYTQRGTKWQFEGSLDGDLLTGTCRRGKRTEPFLLVREGTPDEARLTSAAGMYTTEDGRRFALTKSLHLILTDLSSGEVRALYSKGRDRFTAGPALGIPRPVIWDVTLQGDGSGKIEGFEIRSADGTTVKARRCCEGTSEPFSFETSDGLTLRGTLYLPPGEGPFPAALWVHGSGRADRRGAGTWPWILNDLGIAVLAVDKRGVGESDGRYEMPGGGHDNLPHMKRRSGDVRAGLAALAERSDIRSDRVGLIGGSQAGWVIPMAAADNPLVRFSVILSGGATNISIEGVYSRLAREDGSGVDAPTIESVLERTRAHKPRDPDFVDSFRAMHGPGLWLYGGKDRSNPSRLCIELLEGIRDEYDKDFTIHFFADGNHSLMQAVYGGAGESGALVRRVPGLFDIVGSWLAEQVGDSRAEVSTPR